MLRFSMVMFLWGVPLPETNSHRPRKSMVGVDESFPSGRKFLSIFRAELAV